MKYRRAVPARLSMALAAFVFTTVDVRATTPKDSVYIHCRNDAGDYRISDLNHSVAKYSERYRDYRPLCLLCNVTQWGNVITMDVGVRMSIRIDRMKGYISIRDRGEDNDDDGPGQPRSYHGACVRGQMVADRQPIATPRRVF